MFAASKSGSADAKDANFKNVTMLLHGNGTNGAQNNTFVDSSTNNFTITRNGNTTQGTFSPYGSNWSNYFDGNGDYLSIANNTALNITTGNFTIECWIFCTALTSGNQNVINKDGVAGTSLSQYAIQVTSTGKVRIGVGDGNGTIGQQDLTGATTISLNSWNHIAFVKNSTTLTLYLNGVSDVSATQSVTMYSGTKPLLIGWQQGQPTAEYFNGYISNARLVKGTAVYTSAFTPPTAPLTAITNTSLLTCADNRFIDDSTNNFTITRNGDVSVQRFSPFSPTSAYTTSVIGGSGYFDGSGDYLSFATGTAALGSSDFSIEAWVYPRSAITSVTLTSGQSDLATVAGSSWTFNLGSSSAAALYVGSGGDYGITSASPVINAWNHVVFCRTGGTISTYLNGNRVATRTDLGSSSVNTGSTNNPPSVGASPSGGNAFPGFIAGLRRIIGSGGFSATGTTITVPTAPPTAVTNTNLLLNFTNAGILDNAMMNDLETVGNAQISTSVKKFGTGSLYFDGTGDWLSVPDSQNFNFGSGNFTIEFWIYLNSVSGTIGILGKRTNEANYAPFIMIVTSSALKVYMSINGSLWAVNGLSTSTLSTSTWYNIAVTRSGSTVYMFLNGTSVGSTGTLSGALMTNTSPLYIGADSGSPSGSSTLNGYIDDLRITKGVARYTANFTAPTAPFPDKG